MGIRVTSMLVAIGCALVAGAIAKGQDEFCRVGVRAHHSAATRVERMVREYAHPTSTTLPTAVPILALIFTLGQPMLFLHSFAEMTELPFALLLGSGFLAWQSRRFTLATVLVSWSPLARPEGFGIVAIMFVVLLLYRQGGLAVLLPIPVILWDIAGWLLADRAGPWWGWLAASWPYAGQSMYASGNLFRFVAMLPTVVPPLAMPAMLVGIWLSMRFQRRVPAANGEGTDREAKHQASGPPFSHLDLCRLLTALLPIFVLVVHSVLFWRGKMASSGEPRYLLVVAPFWGVLSARGWAWIFQRLNWRHAVGWAGPAVLVPPMVANFISPAVPVPFVHDWRTARQMVEWYRSSPLRINHPRVTTSHPGVYFFLDVNPYGSPGVATWGNHLVADMPDDTVLIWDPIFGGKNACTELAVQLDDIRKAGWREIFSVPVEAEDNQDIPAEARANPSDPRRFWHVFISGKKS